jgi:hypothetical protein
MPVAVNTVPDDVVAVFKEFRTAELSTSRGTGRR